MFYVFVNNGIVQEIIPEIDPAFPTIPIEDRFQPEFLSLCIKSEYAVPLGWYYDSENGFVETAPILTEPKLQVTRESKLAEISAACQAIIFKGVDVETNNGLEHFNLTQEDQSNISNLFRVVELGGTEYPYQADDGVCRVYSATEIANIYLTAQTLITTQLTYHNALKAYILSMDNDADFSEIVYGMDLPEPFMSNMVSKLLIAEAQIDIIVARLATLTSGDTA